MGVVRGLIICLVAVWLRKGSCLPIDVPNDRADHEEQKMEDDLSPNDIALKNVIAFFQSKDARLKQHAKEVYLETNEVEVTAGDEAHNVTAGDEAHNVTAGDEAHNVTGF
ncbi:polysialoglycoprotein [Nematolebias whitei]|uniref:polysialoglycoprotein n=1 Tax=Nematolebias whitei TaxID=451745 RepID=UPI0018988CA2|nr:polysialoglycoprotein [Nematolebias whitei]